MLIKPVYIYAGKLKTPETGKYKANKAYIAEPCIKELSPDHWQLYRRNTGHKYLFMYSSYTETPEANGSKRKQTEAADRPNTGQHTETADRRKYINHSGNAGNRFQAPQNQQKPSDHDKLMTSNPNCHNFQTISKSCTVSFQIMEKSKKRYIIRTYTQGSGGAGNQQKRPDDHGKRPDRNSFQILATILIFCGRGFANRYFTEIHSLYAPCPDCPVLYPNIYLRKLTGIFQHFPTFFQRFQRLERIGAGSFNAFNASQKAEISDLIAFSTEKSQIHNIKCRFCNINNSNNLNNPYEPFGVSEQLTEQLTERFS